MRDTSSMVTKPTQLFLEPEQKNALRAKARAHGTRLAEELRRAIDAYLIAASPRELKLLDEGSRKAARDLSEMSQEIERINARLDDAFANLSFRRLNARRRRK